MKIERAIWDSQYIIEKVYSNQKFARNEMKGKTLYVSFKNLILRR